MLFRSNRVAAFFKDGRFFGVWDAKSQRALLEHHFPEGEKPISVAITPDQSQFVVQTTERKIYLASVINPKIIPFDMAGSQLRQCIHLAVLEA